MDGNLLDIGEGPLCHVIKHQSCKNIMRLRQVCHDLRNIVDEKKPDIKLSFLRISFEKKRIKLRIDDRIDKYPFSEQYSCDMAQIDEFWNHCKMILMHQKSPMWRMIIEVDEFNTAIKRFFESLKTTLESRKRQLKVSEVWFEIMHHPSIVMSVLPYLDTEYIKEIYLLQPGFHRAETESAFDLKNIVQLEQWKKAKEIRTFDYYFPIPLKHFEHFERAKFSLESVTADELIKVIEKKCTPASFESRQSKAFDRYEIKCIELKNEQKFLDQMGTPKTDTPSEIERGEEEYYDKEYLGPWKTWDYETEDKLRIEVMFLPWRNEITLYIKN